MAGQSVSLVKKKQKVSEILDELVSQASEQLELDKSKN